MEMEREPKKFMSNYQLITYTLILNTLKLHVMIILVSNTYGQLYILQLISLAFLQ